MKLFAFVVIVVFLMVGALAQELPSVVNDETGESRAALPSLLYRRMLVILHHHHDHHHHHHHDHDHHHDHHHHD